MKRPLLSRLWCVSGTAAPVPNDKYEAGFLKEKPDEEYLNQLQKEEETFYLANMETGVPTKNSSDSVTYAEGSVFFENGKLMVWKDGTVSESFFGRTYQVVTEQLYALYRSIDYHLKDYPNPHKVTASQVGTYSKEEFDALLTGKSTEVSAHVSRKDNPHKVTHTHINSISAVDGGKFTGVVGFTSILLGGVKVGNYGDDFLVGDETKAIGVGGGSPIAYIEGKRQVLFTKGNYLTERNKLESLMRIPVPILKAPLVTSLSFATGYFTTVTDWDNLVFTGDGLTLAGNLSVDRPDLVVCDDQTVRVVLKGAVTIHIGHIDIINTAEGCGVLCKGALVYGGASPVGSITCSLTGTKCSAYIGGLLVGTTDVSVGSPPPITFEVSGTGSVKELTIWAEGLDKFQVSKLG